MTNQKILVTGSNGQLGKELQQLSLTSKQFEFVFLSREILPIDDSRALKKQFEHLRPLYCINCAAYTAVDKAETEKKIAFRINAEAVGELAAMSKQYGCHFIHISTDYVFDGNASVPYNENSPTRPGGVYGESKLEGEKLALRFNPHTVIIRTSWLYSEFGKNFVKTMLRLMNEKPEISVVNDQLGSPTYAADLAEALEQIIVRISGEKLPNPKGGVYHFSNSGIISWYDFALAIKELSGSTCKVRPIPTSQYPTPAMRPAYSVLDKSKIARVFGIQLKDWRKSLEVCIRSIERRESRG